jgi:ATP-dependent DNA helicase RecQ
VKDIKEILRRYWEFESFREPQDAIIKNVLEGRDTLALLPTGGGKSICFQVPAMAMEGLCIVVSPLIALIKDQVENLRKKDIPALMIHAGMTFKQVDNILKLATTAEYKFLYLSPERLETKLFLEYLPAMHINLIAVDESHCISQWGYDFRPPYLRIAGLRAHLPGVPVLALTASATPLVQKDICDKLAFVNHTIFQKSFKRENLSYSAFEVSSKINKAVSVLHAVPGSAIVYCKTRRRVVEVSELLNYYNINASYYHAGLSNDERAERQQSWLENKTRVIVCTNAFGMGIDKSDVRVVIHYDVPDCLENYYQEAGRAGRDGNKAYAVLLYYPNDIAMLNEMVEQRFPAPTVIKDIYLSVCQYLGLGVNEGKGQYFPFDLREFCARFKLPILQVYNVLRVLEQEAFLSFSESVFMPSTVEIVASRTVLRQIEESQTVEDRLLKTLLRTYSGIMTNPVSISEKNLAFLLQWSLGDVIAKLELLDKKGLIQYEPNDDSPQIYFVHERVESYSFKINTLQYEASKNNYAEKIAAMQKFALEKTACRSTVISNYFGTHEEADCGKCDNCIEKNKRRSKKEERQQLMAKIIAYINANEPVNLAMMRHTFFNKNNAEEVQECINILLAEEYIFFENEYFTAK